MTTSTLRDATVNLATVPGASFLPWISRGLEGLWLLAVFLVPLMFLNQDYAISEAKIAYVEVPKVALLRTLAGLIALVWSLEWAIKSQALQGSRPSISFRPISEKLRPTKAVSISNHWLRVHPTRWLLLAVGLFFGTTLLSTILSGSVTNSIWGEIPGQDGYSAYSMASYGVLFAVIATHLKSQSQLVRLLAAIVLMGVLVGLYGSLQYYNNDFLRITESTGGGSARITAFMGNTIFAAAVLSMTVPVTLIAASISFQIGNWGNWKPISILRPLGRDTAFTFLWAAILAVQLLGLLFTYSRGSWAGTVLAVTVLLLLVVFSFGFRLLIRTGLVLGLAGVLSVAFLQWQDSFPTFGIGSWLGFVVALLGLAGTFAVLFLIKSFSRTIVFILLVGALVTVVGALVTIPTALPGGGDTDTTIPGASGDRTALNITDKVTSIKTDVLSGFSGGRDTHWKVSWEVIKNRPWFEFDDLSLQWLRPLIGYGPDLFRYTYLLEAKPDKANILFEPDHAHNFFIHQTVEQGIFGGFASLALFASVFGIVGHRLLFKRTEGNPLYRLLLFGLMATVLGRFLEMMVGVARISDLTVLWVIFGLLAASISFDGRHQEKADSNEIQSSKRTNLRARRRATSSSTAQKFSAGLIVRLAIVAWLAGGIGVVTWQKGINPVRASIAEGRALKYFHEGDLESSLSELDRAIKWAPGVPTYHRNRAELFFFYQLNPETLTEPGCSQQSELTYLVCIGIKVLESNLESVRQQPFNFKAWIEAGNSAHNLELNSSAMESYTNAVNLLPYSWNLRNDLARVQIDLGLYNEALNELDFSLELTGDTPSSVHALYLKGQALMELGQLENAKILLKHGLSLSYTSDSASASLNLLRKINIELGIDLDIEYFDSQIAQNAQDAVAHYFRGLIHLTLGNSKIAHSDIQTSISLGLTLLEVQAYGAYAQIKGGTTTDTLIRLLENDEAAPQIASVNAFYSEQLRTQGVFVSAFRYAEDASILDPDLGLPYLIRGKIFMTLGLEDSAKAVLSSSVGLELPTSLDYADRGGIFASLGEFDLAFSDWNDAIRINPNKARYYNSRAKTYASIGEFESALANFNAAIEKDPEVGQYFINRGVVYKILGDTDRSVADFESARSLDEIIEPHPVDRNQSYFRVITDTNSREGKTRQLLKFEMELEADRNIRFYSEISPDKPNYPSALKNLGQTYLGLESWVMAEKALSQLLKLSPGHAEALRNRGSAYLALKYYQQAIDDYAQAIMIDPLNSENFVARGKGYAEFGEFGLALDDFTEAIKLNPKSSDAYKFRGYLSVQTGNHSLAFSDLNRAIEISPLNHEAYLKRANAYIGLGQTTLAMEDLERAINLAPTNSDYLYNRGSLHFALSDYNSAIEDYSGAILLREPYANFDPRHARPYVGRGKAYLQLGKPEQAIVDANRALRLLSEMLKLYNPVYYSDYKLTIENQMADGFQLLGDSYVRLGNQELAQKEYQQASELR